MVYITSLCCTGQDNNTKHNQWGPFSPALSVPPGHTCEGAAIFLSVCLRTCHALQSLLACTNKWRLICRRERKRQHMARDLLNPEGLTGLPSGLVLFVVLSVLTVYRARVLVAQCVSQFSQMGKRGARLAHTPSSPACLSVSRTMILTEWNPGVLSENSRQSLGVRMPNLFPLSFSNYL